jgi:hypothetical protein
MHPLAPKEEQGSVPSGPRPNSTGPLSPEPEQQEKRSNDVPATGPSYGPMRGGPAPGPSPGLGGHWKKVEMPPHKNKGG